MTLGNATEIYASRQMKLAAFVKRLAAGAGTEMSLDGALNKAGDIIPAETVLLMEYEKDYKRIQYRHGAYISDGGHRDLPSFFPFDENSHLYKRLAQSGFLPAAVDDAAGSAYGDAVGYGIRSALIVPVRVFDELWGLLIFCKSCAHAWDENEISTGDIIGGIIAGAIVRTTLERGKSAKGAAKQKTDFLSRMSHEMRTPMNAIIGMTNIARNTTDAMKKDFCLEKIDAAGRHLLDVINDILDMSEIESNKFNLSYEEFEIDEMAANVTEALRQRITEKKQRLTVNIGEDVPVSIIGDVGRVSQAITHLLSNAEKFTHVNGEIVLNIFNEKETDGRCTLKVEVKDNGIGIQPEMQKRIFKPFEQGDGGIAREYGGIGLGLVLVKHIVEMMEGHIWFTSEPGKGSSFMFTVNVKKGSRAARKHAHERFGAGKADVYGADTTGTKTDGAAKKTPPEQTETNVKNEKGGNTMGNGPGGYAGVIDLEGGLKRLANNKKLYFRLLSNFKGRQMADEVIASIKEADFAKVSAAAHAIKGVASNLGITNLTETAKIIEEQAKQDMIAENAADLIDRAAEEAIAAIAALLAEEGAV